MKNSNRHFSSILKYYLLLYNVELFRNVRLTVQTYQTASKVEKTDGYYNINMLRISTGEGTYSKGNDDWLGSPNISLNITRLCLFYLFKTGKHW